MSGQGRVECQSGAARALLLLQAGRVMVVCGTPAFQPSAQRLGGNLACAHPPHLPSLPLNLALPPRPPAPRVVKLVRALRKGWIKREQEPEKPAAYLLWEDDGALIGGCFCGSRAGNADCGSWAEEAGCSCQMQVSLAAFRAQCMPLSTGTHQYHSSHLTRPQAALRTRRPRESLTSPPPSSSCRGTRRATTRLPSTCPPR